MNIDNAQQWLTFYAAKMTAINGGREYTHTIDGVKQYPDATDLKALRMQLLVEKEPISQQ